MYTPKDPKYEKLYAVTTFLSPLQSNLLSEQEKKIAKEYLKDEAKKLEEHENAVNAALENDHEPADHADEEDDVYIPGAGRLDRLNTRDLRRLNHEAEFDTRFVTPFEFCRCYFTYIKVCPRSRKAEKGLSGCSEGAPSRHQGQEEEAGRSSAVLGPGASARPSLLMWPLTSSPSLRHQFTANVSFLIKNLIPSVLS